MGNLRAKLREWMLPIIACFGVLMAIFTVMTRKDLEKKDPLVPPPQTTYKVAVAGIGVIEPLSELIAIGVELPGVVREVLCKVGDQVTQGTPLFALDTRDADAQILVLEAAIAGAKIQADDMAQQFELVRNVIDKRAVSKDEYNRKYFAMRLAREKLKEMQAQLQQARTTRDRLIIKAPISGRILEINIHPGEYASAGVLTPPLMRMGDVSQLVVRTEVDEEFAQKVDPVQQATGYPRGANKEPLKLSFLRFEPFIKPKQNLAVAGSRIDTRVLQVLYTIDHAGSDVFVGQQMDVFINAEKQEKPDSEDTSKMLQGQPS